MPHKHQYKGYMNCYYNMLYVDSFTFPLSGLAIINPQINESGTQNGNPESFIIASLSENHTLQANDPLLVFSSRCSPYISCPPHWDVWKKSWHAGPFQKGTNRFSHLKDLKVITYAFVLHSCYISFSSLPHFFLV